MRMDIVQYVARGVPPLRADLMSAFKPREETLVSKPEELLPRFHAIRDDGHTVKVARAMLLAQRLSQKYADRPWIRIKDDDMWLKIHYCLLEGTESTGEEGRWVRTAGFEEAWKSVPKAE